MTARCRAGLLAAAFALAAAAPALGAGWLEPMDLSTADSDVVNDAEAAITADSTIVVADRRRVWVRPPGGPVGAPITLAGPSATATSDLAARDGAISVAIADGSNLELHRRPAGASAFEPPLTFPGAMPLTADLQITPDGTTVLTWLADAPRRVMLAEVSSSGLISGAISDAARTARTPALGARPDGTMVVAWGSSEALVGDDVARIEFARRPAAGPFGSPATIQSYNYDPAVNTISLEAQPPSVAPDGAAAVPWVYTNDEIPDGHDQTAVLTTVLAPDSTTIVGTQNLDTAPGNANVAGGIGFTAHTIALGGERFLTSFAEREEPNTTALEATRGNATGPPAPNQVLFVGNGPIFASSEGLVSLGPGNGHLLMFGGLPTPAKRSAVAPQDAPFEPLGPVIAGLETDSAGLSPLSGDGAGNAVTAVNRSLVRQLIVYDGTPPVLGARSIPASATAGTPITLTAAASDALSAVTLSWDFGDGTTATGPSVSKSWATAGTRTVTVTATDQGGNTATATDQVTVAAARLPPAPPVGEPQRDVTKPRLSGLNVPKRPRRRAAITVSFRVDELSRIVVTLERVTKGRGRRGTPCRARAKTGPRCTVYQRVKRLSPRDLQGPGTVKLALRTLRQTRLAAGSYRVTVAAVDSAGNGPVTARANFTVRR